MKNVWMNSPVNVQIGRQAARSLNDAFRAGSRHAAMTSDLLTCLWSRGRNADKLWSLVRRSFTSQQLTNPTQCGSECIRPSCNSTTLQYIKTEVVITLTFSKCYETFLQPRCTAVFVFTLSKKTRSGPLFSLTHTHISKHTHSGAERERKLGL